MLFILDILLHLEKKMAFSLPQQDRYSEGRSPPQGPHPPTQGQSLALWRPGAEAGLGRDSRPCWEAEEGATRAENSPGLRTTAVPAQQICIY